MSGPGRGNWTIMHGGSRRSGRAPEYNVWAKMRARCENENSRDYKNYGGRDIRVCEAWSDFSTFLRDMGPRPSRSHTIERKDNNAGYGPDNCIWATRAVQAQNRRDRVRPEFCKQGHPLSGDNLYERPDGKRGCRQCRRSNMRSYYERKSQEASNAAI